MKRIMGIMGVVCPLALVSQCKKCEGAGFGKLGGGDEEVGGAVGHSWAGGDVARRGE